MFFVIINRCEKEHIEYFKEKNNIEIFINDQDIYSILNSEKEFNGKIQSLNKIEDFADQIVGLAEEKNILLHTFNPLLLNFFEDEVARNSFFEKKKDGSFVKFFEKNEYKLEVMNPGEAVSDTLFEC